MALGSGGRDLRVNLISDVSKFAKGLRSAENDARSFSQKSAGMFKGLGIAAAGAAAAVAGMAVAVGVDAVKAAISEEQSVGKLTKTLKNLGLAHEGTKVEKFIDDMQFATGVADDELRPAYDRLIRSTGNVDEANRALGIALDIAVAKGLDVLSVANVLGKAYDGNTTALGRMGAGLDKAILKSGDMKAITQALIDKFGGSANSAANTLGGAIQGVQIGWDELVESFGQGLVGDTADDIQKLKLIQQQLRDMQPAAQNAGEDIRSIGTTALTTYDRLDALGEAASRKDWSQFFGFLSSGDDDKDWQRKVEQYRRDIAEVDRTNAEAKASSQSFEQALLDQANAAGVAAPGLEDLDDAAGDAADSLDDATQATEEFTGATKAAAAAAPGFVDGLYGIKVGAERVLTPLQRLQGAIAGVFSSAGSYGQAQEKFAAKLGWTQLLSGGPSKSGGSGKNAFSTKDDYLNFANAIVSQASSYAGTLGPKQANKVLQNAQDRVAALLAQAGYADPRKTAAGLIGPVNINPHPRPWEQMYRDGPTSKTNVDPSRTRTRERDAAWRADARTAQLGARTRPRS